MNKETVLQLSLSNPSFRDWMMEVALKLSDNSVVIDLRRLERGSIRSVAGVLINLTRYDDSDIIGRYHPWLSPVISSPGSPDSPGSLSNYFHLARNPFIRCTRDRKQKLCLAPWEKGTKISSTGINTVYGSTQDLMRGEVLVMEKEDNGIEYCIYMDTQEFIETVLGGKRFQRTKSARF